MIDPVTAATTATKCFALFKACVETGKSAEDAMMHASRWWGAASDVFYADKKAKNVSVFKKLVLPSATADAARIFALRKKCEQQHKEINQFILYAYGKDGLDEFREIKQQVLKEQKLQQFKQQELRETLGLSTIVAALLGALAWVINLIVSEGR
jgi:cell fate (sporulation/competence/biofilm development) regulator YlbF (YheA/YmcA/DUF963 family)